MTRFFKYTLGVLVLYFSSTASSAPYLYTFIGTINYIEIDGAFYSDVDFDNDYTTTEDTFLVGETIQYTYLIDFDLPGFCNGPLATNYSSTCTGNDIPDSTTANYFFADLIAATKLAPPTEEDTTFNYGLSLANLGWVVGDSAVFIKSPFNEPVEQWVAESDTSAGTIVTGTDSWAAPGGFSPYGLINSTLTLTSIEPYAMEEPQEPKYCKRKGHKHDHKYHREGHEEYYEGEHGGEHDDYHGGEQDRDYDDYHGKFHEGHDRSVDRKYEKKYRFKSKKYKFKNKGKKSYGKKREKSHSKKVSYKSKTYSYKH